MVSCDEPYIGDESITRPPASTKLRMTSAQASRATGSSPTLNVIQLPRPTAGSASPVEGIGRVRIARGGACANEGRSVAERPVAANARNAWRRSHMRALRSALVRDVALTQAGPRRSFRLALR